MKIQVITSCTGEKRHSPPNQLLHEDFHRRLDSALFKAREQSLSVFAHPAEDLYTGQQHARLMSGVQEFRQSLSVPAVDLWILSAGYGLIPSDQRIVPYECTFQGMKIGELREWADHLRVPETARKLLLTRADFTLVLLGDSYLRALNLDSSTEFKSPTLFFTSHKSQRFVQGSGKVRVVTLSNQDTKRFSCGLVGLKGELGKRLLACIAKEGEAFISNLFDPANDVLALLAPTEEPKAAKTKKVARSNPAVDRVIEIPRSWWKKPHRAKLRYFIPEWDDLVDPDYDFETDTHSGGTGDWSNEVYAHQIYPEPNYDGILISKVVAEKSAKKKERINRLGVHRFLRVPREFPVMGDCGAFGYIMEETPPYTTAEILDYYTRLDFDYGVSIDHLIVKATEDQKRLRYELTIHNAEEFLSEHRKRRLRWTPIGAVQGWDAKSYADAAARYVAMGYGYIALGGLVRTTTLEIMRVLEAVQRVVPESVAIHLFGIARVSSLGDFARLGVRSVDSASFLRRAWMGTGQNYLTSTGELYTAIRIPEAGKSFRAKRMVSEERSSTYIESLEKNCLRAMIDFDMGRISVEQALDVLEAYDRLITPERDNTRDLLRRTLEASPWKSCPCTVCRKHGIRVIIFRGNNRNRRRGFHNTYVFYDLLQRILAGEPVKLGLGLETAALTELPLFASGGVVA
jgi:hypothetical protein